MRASVALGGNWPQPGGEVSDQLGLDSEIGVFCDVGAKRAVLTAIGRRGLHPLGRAKPRGHIAGLRRHLRDTGAGSST